MKITRAAILFLILMCFNLNSKAQSDFMMPNNTFDVLQEQRSVLLEQRRTVVAFNCGLTVALGWNNTSEFKFNLSAGIFQGFGAISKDHVNFLGSYMIQLECFRGGPGSSLLDKERARFEVELRNIFQLNGGWISGNPVKGRPLHRALGASVSPIRDPFDYSLGLATIFVNGLTHKRNQQVGMISVGALEVSAAYANDGPPFHVVGLGDSHDRYWSGSGYLGFYFASNYGFVTSFSLQYQRYTGWQPNLYEMANLLDLDYMSYKNKKEQYLNQGVWNWSIGIRNNYEFNLKTYEAEKTDVQDMIHIARSFTFHPNTLTRRLTMGASFNLSNFQTVLW